MIRMIFALALLGATPGFAQFQGPDDRLFINWPDLDEEYQAGAEFLIHAIVPPADFAARQSCQVPDWQGGPHARWHGLRRTNPAR